MNEIEVVCVPPDDPAFELKVCRLAHSQPELTIEEVEAVVLVEDPQARLFVRPSPVSVMPGERRLAWYAYRDGRMN